MNSAPMRLRKLISNHYSLDEFRTLCFDLGVRYDDLGGDSLNGQVRELLLLLARHGRLADLLVLLAAERPSLLAQTGYAHQADLLRDLIAALPGSEERGTRSGER